MNKINKQSGFTLIEILVVIGIIAILATIVLIAINPARQFKQAHDTQRVSNVNAILNAIGQYMADNKGAIPAAASMTTSLQNIKTGVVDLCALLVPTYMPAFPVDPNIDADGAGVATLSKGDAIPSTSCSTAYDTGYQVSKDANDRITVKAPSAEVSTLIQVTR